MQHTGLASLLMPRTKVLALVPVLAEAKQGKYAYITQDWQAC